MQRISKRAQKLAKMLDENNNKVHHKAHLAEKVSELDAEVVLMFAMLEEHKPENEESTNDLLDNPINR